MNEDHPKSMLKAIQQNPHDAAARLRALRSIVAHRLDGTSSARETASLAASFLAVEVALKAATAEAPGASRVDELLSRRAKRGAK